MEKNIKVDEDLWRELQKEKFEEGYDKISDLIKRKNDFVKKIIDKKDFKIFFEKRLKPILLTYEEVDFVKLSNLKNRLQIVRKESITWEEFFMILKDNLERMKIL